MGSTEFRGLRCRLFNILAKWEAYTQRVSAHGSQDFLGKRLCDRATGRTNLFRGHCFLLERTTYRLTRESLLFGGSLLENERSESVNSKKTTDCMCCQ